MILFKHQFSITTNQTKAETINLVKQHTDIKKKSFFDRKNKKTFWGKISEKDFLLVRNSLGQWQPDIKGKIEHLKNQTIIQIQIEQTEFFYVFMAITILLIISVCLAMEQMSLSSIIFAVFATVLYYSICLVSFIFEVRDIKRKFRNILI